MKSMKYVVSSGEMLIDLTQSGGGGSAVFEAHPGGAPANVAVGIARLGGRSRFFGKLSSDWFGDLLLRTLKKNGVDADFIPERSERQTALAVVSLDKSGNRRFAFYHDRSADTRLTPGEVSGKMFDDASIFHFGSVSMATDPPRSAMVRLVENAKSAKCLVSCDLNMREDLWPEKRDIGAVLKFLLSNSDIFKCSEEELHLLECGLKKDGSRKSGGNYSDRSIRRCIDELLSAGPGMVIVTRGRGGAVVGCENSIVSVPAFRVRAVDTTGAGDAFTAALLYRLVRDGFTDASGFSVLSESTLTEIGRFCNAAAGFSCMHYGGIDSLPTIREISEILKTAK
ncbi:MAG: carbohydrate kinase [Thermoplasmata archaeon]|nr:carbohydrate kinase [Candidatus Sysuiplasma jiujiangense]